MRLERTKSGKQAVRSINATQNTTDEAEIVLCILVSDLLYIIYIGSARSSVVESSLLRSNHHSCAHTPGVCH